MTLTKPLITDEILESLKPKVEEEKQVIVHCCFPATASVDMLIRIWHSTFLIDRKLDHQSTLIHHENISLFPYWTEVPPHKDYWFSLIFSGLPRDCTFFDLSEEIPEDGGFLIKNIKRNPSDIYRVKIS